MTTTKFDENPVNAQEAARILGMAPSTISALKRSMGITSRKVFLSDLRKFLRNNPKWRTTLVYHRKSCRCSKCLIRREAAAPAAAASQLPAPVTQTLPATKSVAVATSMEPGKPGFRVSGPAKSDLGAKLHFLRGNRRAGEVAKQTGLSRESVYRIERGDAVKLSTVKALARALGAGRAETVDLYIAWIKQNLGADAEDLLIEARSGEKTAHESVMERQASEVRTLLAALSVTQRDQLIMALQSREILNCINIMVRLASGAAQPAESGEKQQKPFAAVG